MCEAHSFPKLSRKNKKSVLKKSIRNGPYSVILTAINEGYKLPLHMKRLNTKLRSLQNRKPPNGLNTMDRENSEYYVDWLLFYDAAKTCE